MPSSEGIVLGDVERWRSERRQILNTMEWQFANGHGCSMGSKAPAERKLIAEVERLTALIEEHSA